MLEVSRDKSIHRDGIYDIDESCSIRTKSMGIEDNIVFAILALFVFFK